MWLHVIMLWPECTQLVNRLVTTGMPPGLLVNLPHLAVTVEAGTEKGRFEDSKSVAVAQTTEIVLSKTFKSKSTSTPKVALQHSKASESLTSTSDNTRHYFLCRCIKWILCTQCVITAAKNTKSIPLKTKKVLQNFQNLHSLPGATCNFQEDQLPCPHVWLLAPGHSAWHHNPPQAKPAARNARTWAISRGFKPTSWWLFRHDRDSQWLVALGSLYCAVWIHQPYLLLMVALGYPKPRSHNKPLNISHFVETQEPHPLQKFPHILTTIFQQKRPSHMPKQGRKSRVTLESLWGMCRGAVWPSP